MTILSMFSFLTSCGCPFPSSSRGNKYRPRKKNRTVQMGVKKPNLRSNVSSKALLMVKMVSWKKRHDEEEESYYSDDDDEAIWKRTIIMGEKCRPLEFSGNILYDSNGNLLPDSLHQNPQQHKNLVS